MKEIEKKEFMVPDYIYIPYDKIVRKKVGDNVCFEEVIGTLSNRYIYPSISGVISKETDVKTINGNKNAIVIENNFQDKRKKTFPSYKSIYDIKKEELKSVLEGLNISFKKSIILQINYIRNIDSDAFFFEEHVEYILELLDLLNEYLKKDVYISVDKNDRNALSTLDKYKESYPNINVIYNRSDKDVISLFELYNLYLLLKSKRLLTYKYITIIDKGKTYNVKVKLYTKIKDLFKYLKITTYSEITLFDIDLNQINYKDNIIIDEWLLGIMIN